MWELPMLFFAVLKHRENANSKLGKSFPLGPQVQTHLCGFLRILVDEGLISVMINSRHDQSQIKDQVQHFSINILLG